LSSPPAPLASPNRVVAIACAATFLAFLDVTVVNIAFPDIERDFAGVSLSVLSWVVTAYAIVFAAALAPAGRLADVLGRKQVFLGGMGLFVAASAASALAPSVEALIATRAIQGIGAAFMIPAALGLILTAVPLEKRSAAIGMWGAATSIAAALGPAVGGVVVDLTDWRAVFAINIPIGVLVMWIAARELPATERGEQRLPDLPGTLLLTAGLAGIATSLAQAGEWGWGDTRTLALGGAGLAVLAYSLLRARNHAAPAIHVSLWRNRNFAVANLSVMLFGVLLFAWLLGGVIFLAEVWHYSLLQAGFAVTPGALTSAIAAVLAGRWIDRLGARVVVFAGALILAAVGAYLAAELTAERQFFELWLPSGMISGFGFGAVSVGTTTAAARALPPDKFAAGVGLNMTARQLGGAIGVALMASILTSVTDIDGYRWVYAMCAAAGLATAFAGLALREGAVAAAPPPPAGVPAGPAPEAAR
jgi:EmrB/QacA subfamily drug resistance transporter